MTDFAKMIQNAIANGFRDLPKDDASVQLHNDRYYVFYGYNKSDDTYVSMKPLGTASEILLNTELWKAIYGEKLVCIDCQLHDCKCPIVNPDGDAIDRRFIPLYQFKSSAYMNGSQEVREAILKEMTEQESGND